MTTKNKIEISTGILFLLSIGIWTFFPCAGIGCHMERLPWVMIYTWSGSASLALYLLWKKW